MPSTLLDLPAEILIDNILSRLDDPQSLYNLLLVCKYSKNAASTDLLWRPFLLEEYQHVKNPKKSFFQEAHKVKSAYLGENHPTFKHFYPDLKEMVETVGYLRSKEHDHTLYLKQKFSEKPILTILALALLSGAPSSFSRLFLKKWKAPNVTISLYEIASMSSRAMVYSLQNIPSQKLLLRTLTPREKCFRRNPQDIFEIILRFPAACQCVLNNTDVREKLYRFENLNQSFYLQKIERRAKERSHDDATSALR